MSGDGRIGIAEDWELVTPGKDAEAVPSPEQPSPEGDWEDVRPAPKLYYYVAFQSSHESASITDMHGCINPSIPSPSVEVINYLNVWELKVVNERGENYLFTEKKSLWSHTYSPKWDRFDDEVPKQFCYPTLREALEEVNRIRADSWKSIQSGICDIKEMVLKYETTMNELHSKSLDVYGLVTLRDDEDD